MRKLLRDVTGLLVVLAAAGWGRAWAAGLSDADTKRAQELIQQLGDSDSAKRAAAETELRRFGAAVLPALQSAKVDNEAGQLRLRTILVDLTVDGSRIDAADGNTLTLLGREEALAKRYWTAAKCYRRAEKIYDRLKDDADDRHDKIKEREYKDLRDRAENRANRAEHLAKGERFTGVNLGIVKIGVEHNAGDQDW
jgi:hypothetical protein